MQQLDIGFLYLWLLKTKAPSETAYVQDKSIMYIYSMCVRVCVFAWHKSRLHFGWGITLLIFPLVSPGDANNAARRQMCVRVFHARRTSVFTHVRAFTCQRVSSIMRTLLPFCQIHFPLIPPVTNAGLNYHQSTWLLITQHVKKSWPCVVFFCCFFFAVGGLGLIQRNVSPVCK